MLGNGENDVERFSIEFTVVNHRDVIKAEEGVLPKDNVRRLTMRGVVDSGAGRLVLPKAVVQQLGLPLSGKTKVRYADHRTRTRDTVEQAHVNLGVKGATRVVSRADFRVARSAKRRA